MSYNSAELIDLQNQYNIVYAQYQQAYNNYTQSLIITSFPFVTLQGFTFGDVTSNTGIGSESISDCEALCISGCTGATFDMSSNQCYISTNIYGVNDNPLKLSGLNYTAIIPSSADSLYTLNYLNNILINLNQQIIQLTRAENKATLENIKTEKILLDAYHRLKAEQVVIQQLMAQQETLQNVNSDKSLLVNSNYMKLYLWIFLAILVVFITVLQFRTSPEELTTKVKSQKILLAVIAFIAVLYVYVYVYAKSTVKLSVSF